mmetsp:Transcript_39749/g.63706  ORF Transcript_39749/g.63706 Transcript_39749/m.63706 type:complete len:107 (+) Transcript_39749:78-398(+)
MTTQAMGMKSIKCISNLPKLSKVTQYNSARSAFFLYQRMMRFKTAWLERERTRERERERERTQAREDYTQRLQERLHDKKHTNTHPLIKGSNIGALPVEGLAERLG